MVGLMELLIYTNNCFGVYSPVVEMLQLNNIKENRVYLRIF